MKPILNNVYAFDATLEYEFEFSYSGNQPYKNRLIIKNNLTNVTVYDETLTTMQLKHTLPASSITNSTTAYNAQLITYDSENTASDLSDAIVFYAYLSPTFEFSNLTEDQKIENSSFSPILTYSQTQSELLSSYEITLYDSLKVELTSSDPIYITTGTLTYTFSNLQDNRHYYLRATGETVHHMLLDTGYVEFVVDYIRPAMFSEFEITNEPLLGAVRVSSNVFAIGFISSLGNSTTYINNTAVDLSDEGSYVIVDDGFALATDFTLHINGYNFTVNSLILESLNESLDKIQVWYKEGDINGESDKAYIKLRVISYILGISYTTISNLIAIPSSNDNINIWIRKKDDLYEVVIANTA